MKIEIENLKALVYQRDLNIYQKAKAIEEFVKLQDYINRLEQCNIADVVHSLPCRHTFVQKDEYWKRCSHCGEVQPLRQ